MNVTPSGMVTEVRLEQPEKALPLMDVTLSGIINSKRQKDWQKKAEIFGGLGFFSYLCKVIERRSQPLEVTLIIHHLKHQEAYEQDSQDHPSGDQLRHHPDPGRSRRHDDVKVKSKKVKM